MRYSSGEIKIRGFLKIILFLSGLVLISIQFIVPGKNENLTDSANDISKTIHMPDSVMTMLRTSCYDCHSNNTRYPWYFRAQPVGWLLARHIESAKSELNFSHFGNYSARRQISMMDRIESSIEDNTMPLPTYRLMHKDARLSADEKKMLIKWTMAARDSLSLKK